MSSSQPSPRVQKTSPVDPDGVVRCYHGEPAVIRTSRTPLNPNRDFWACGHPFVTRCKDFFHWVDDPLVVGANQPSNTSQQQRTEHRSQNSVPETPGRSKRLEDIERGLQERSTNQSSSGALGSSQSSNESPTSSIQRSLAHQPPVPSLQTRTPSVEWEELPPTTPTNPPYSFLGLYSSSVASPVTPQERRRQLEPDEPENSILLTPPDTIHRPGPAASTSIGEIPHPITPTKNKGKERAFDSVSSQNEENPFIQGLAMPQTDGQSSLHMAGSVPQLFYSPDSSPGSDVAPTLAEQIAALVIQAKQQVEKLQMTMEQLEQLGSMDYIMRIERQKNALSVSNEAKKKRIAELVAEVAALRNQVNRKT